MKIFKNVLGTRVFRLPTSFVSILKGAKIGANQSTDFEDLELNRERTCSSHLRLLSLHYQQTQKSLPSQNEFIPRVVFKEVTQ